MERSQFGGERRRGLGGLVMGASVAVMTLSALAGEGGSPTPNVVVWGDSQCGLWQVPDDAFPIVQISGGISHIAALRADGVVRVWGCHPGPPEELGGIVQVAAGGHGHTAALRADGTLVMWGENGTGQCDVPPDLGPVVQVECGAGHTVVLLADGTVRAWGNNSLGEATVPEGLESIVMIAAGGRHTLALRSDGTVVCWGYSCAVPAGLENVVQIASGYDSALARLADGSVVCVAGGGPVCATPKGLPSAIDIAAAVVGSAALDANGVVHVWGNSNSGWSLTPPPGLAAVTAITAGWGFLAAITTSSDCNGNGIDDALEIQKGLALDCNGNGVLDECEIALDPSMDSNKDGVLDSCSYARGDLNLDGVVNGADLSIVLSLWGTASPGYADLNSDGVVNGADLAVLLGNWGAVGF